MPVSVIPNATPFQGKEPIPVSLRCDIAGVHFRGAEAKALLATAPEKGAVLRLEPEDNNQHDPFAIRVVYLNEGDGRVSPDICMAHELWVGYIPGMMTPAVRLLMQTLPDGWQVVGFLNESAIKGTNKQRSMNLFALPVE